MDRLTVPAGPKKDGLSSAERASANTLPVRKLVSHAVPQKLVLVSSRTTTRMGAVPLVGAFSCVAVRAVSSAAREPVDAMIAVITTTNLVRYCCVPMVYPL